MLKRPFGQDALFFFPLLDNDSDDWKAGVTIAEGDIKLFTDRVAFANLTAERVAFTSGSEEPKNNDTLVGATSAVTARLLFAVKVSGTWGGGDAAGWLFLGSVSGVLQSENLDISGGASNVLTIPGDSTAGLFAEIGNGLYCCALSATELNCGMGAVRIADQTAGEEWKEDGFLFETEPALSNIGTLAAVTASGGTLAPSAVADADYYKGAKILIYGGTGVGQCERLKTYSAGRAFTLYRDWSITPDTDSKYVVIPDAGVMVLGIEGTDALDDIADAVWDEALAGHVTAGSAGKVLGDVAVGTPPTAEAIADEVETRPLFLDAVYDAAKTAAQADDLADISARLPAALTANGNIKAAVKEVVDSVIEGTGVEGDEFVPV